MTRTGVLILAVLVMLPGTALAQGLLDSIFGSGGLGLWGSQPGNQFDSPQYYGGSPSQGQQGLQGYGYPQQAPQAQGYTYPQQAPQAQGYTYPQQAPQAQGYTYPQQAPQAQGYTYPQQGAPQDQSYAYPQQDYAQQAYPQGQASGSPQGYGNQGYSWQGSTQQGIYSDWQGYQQPAPVPAQPPVQYVAPQTQQAAPAARYVAPQAQTPVTQQRLPSGGPTGPAAAQPIRAAPGQESGFVDDLPPGAVKITTITPDGTTVQYYGPPGEQAQPQPAVAQPQQRARSSAARKPRSGKPSTAGAGQVSLKQKPASRVAMPKPVQIPQGSDPRAGWNVAVDRAPAAPEVTGNAKGPRRQTGR